MLAYPGCDEQPWCTELSRYLGFGTQAGDEQSWRNTCGHKGRLNPRTATSQQRAWNRDPFMRCQAMSQGWLQKVMNNENFATENKRCLHHFEQTTSTRVGHNIKTRSFDKHACTLRCKKLKYFRARSCRHVTLFSWCDLPDKKENDVDIFNALKP